MTFGPIVIGLSISDDRMMVFENSNLERFECFLSNPSRDLNLYYKIFKQGIATNPLRGFLRHKHVPRTCLSISKL